MKSKLRMFARTFWKSLTDPSYYKDILLAKFSFSVKYLFGLIFLISLIVGIGISIRVIKLIPQAPNFIEITKKFVLETYPKELKLTLKDKKIISNVKEPYFIDLPTQAGLPAQAGTSAEAFKHFIAIDTKGKAEDFKGLDSMFVLTADSLVISDSGAGYKAIPLRGTLTKIPDGTYVDKANIESVLKDVTPYFLKLIPNLLKAAAVLLLVIYPLIRTAGSLVVQMLILLPVSLVLFIFARLAKQRVSYTKTYQYCLHGLTIPVVVSFVFGPFSFYPWAVLLAWLVFFAFMIVVLLRYGVNSRL